MLDFKNKLNTEQYEAMACTNGSILILAGAGSGKTRVIIYRVAHLLQQGVSPFNILAVTFTNKAAGEMKERIYNLAGEAAGNIFVSTFHAMCAQLLRSEAINIGLNSNFSICDFQDQKNIAKQCIEKLGYDDKKFVPQVVSAIISRAKDDMKGVREFREEALAKGLPFFTGVADIYELYQKTLIESQNLDFGDLIFKTVEMFETNKEILDKYQERFQYIMVDEFQDTNESQYRLIKFLSGKYKNICVVGDDDQSIYSWRGANINNILNFEKDYKDTKVVKLEQNYRSTKNILKVADKLVKKNVQRKDKTMWTENEEGEKIKHLQVYNEHEEAERIADEINSLVHQGASLNDFAIFYRTNAQSRVFEEIFRKYGISYILVGSIKFYDRKEIKDILAYLKVLMNPSDTINLKRIINVPTRGIGQTSLDLIESLRHEGDSFFDILTNIAMDAYPPNIVSQRLAKNIKSFHAILIHLIDNMNTYTTKEIIAYVLSESGYMEWLYEDTSIYRDSRIENVKELVSAAGDFEEDFGDVTLEGFLQHTALVSDVDKLDKETPRVTLMTLHLAKGLEFPIVFMTGMEEGLFPSAKVDYDKKELEEERRLCFVGMTRAMEKLYCLSANQRRVYGQTKLYLPSRFLKEAGVLEQEEERDCNPYAKFDDFMNKVETLKPDCSPDMLDSFAKGNRVSHPNFGLGRVINISGSGDRKTVIVRFNSGAEKRLLLKYAKLERV
ncbi:MAG: UvrD-helicase domain-containing protein [bacterium]|nr:UvrD-helicase domain-containing protein [bacterium]